LKVEYTPAADGRAKRDCAYNLFQNKERPELICAVPQDRPVPQFLVAERWSFARSLHPEESAPPGFRDRAATTGARFSGFYLFHFVSITHLSHHVVAPELSR
jgi:hypothetical protein